MPITSTLNFGVMIPMDPVGKERPQVVISGGRARTHTPEKTAAAEELVRTLAWEAARKQGSPFFYKTTPLRLGLVFKLTPPKRKTRLWPTTTPDLDNLAKTVMDALTGVVYENDSQIVQLFLSKVYTVPEEKPGISISLHIMGGW